MYLNINISHIKLCNNIWFTYILLQFLPEGDLCYQQYVHQTAIFRNQSLRDDKIQSSLFTSHTDTFHLKLDACITVEWFDKNQMLPVLRYIHLRVCQIRIEFATHKS